jgi:hypothetical protein
MANKCSKKNEALDGFVEMDSEEEVDKAYQALTEDAYVEMADCGLEPGKLMVLITWGKVKKVEQWTIFDSGTNWMLADPGVWEQLEGPEKKCEKIIKGIGGNPSTLRNLKIVKAQTLEKRAEIQVFRTISGRIESCWGEQTRKTWNYCVRGTCNVC